ncbi:hypothetical protein [Halostagnicola sp. A56]|uniref:hypothetical protein n=1 Tax=Halostagnicola sp. A56 TaxID=1495067 RepID=UPI0012E2CB2F|nr:hypothetical protein [Halostagnicola sp. A56]
MFSVWLRAAITFLVAPILILVFWRVMGPITGIIKSFGVGPSSHAGQLTMTAIWFPFIVLLSLVIWIVAAAVYQRSQTGGF